MNYDINKLRQVTPANLDDSETLLPGAVRFEFTDGAVEIVEGMTIFDFLRETKHLR